MAIAVEDISSTKKRLRIEIPADILETEYQRSLDAVRLRSQIPGFRPGKAPVSLIEKKFGGDIRSDLIDKLVPDYYSRALKESNLVPVGYPDMESGLEVKRNEPLVFSFTVEVRPEVENLTYTGLAVDDIPTEVTDNEIEETIKGLQEGRAMYEVVDREVREDDLLIIDYTKFDPTGEKEIVSSKDQVMNLGKHLVPQAIADALIGRKKGDVAEVTLPEVEAGQIKDDNSKGDLLKITIKEVKEKKLPGVDDELAKDFGHDTLEALREKVREGLLRNKKEGAAGKQKGQLLEKLVELHSFDIPESLLSKELESLIQNEKQSRPPAGAPDPENAGANAQAGPTQDDDAVLAEVLKPKAVHSVKASLLLDMIGDREKVSVTEDEIKKRIAVLARHFQTTPDAVINLFVTRDGSLENLSRSIRDEKVLDLVLAKAEITKGA
ncbi:MAG: trigger factor [Nitrospirae bacterium]|nr:MAG: trigger factor [Nitrospirota bacterium]